MDTSIHREKKPISAFPPPLEQRLAEFELIFDAAPVGIFLCDPEFRFIRVNRHLAVEINGIPVERHIGKLMCKIVPELWPILEPILRRVLKSGRSILNIEIEGETLKAQGIMRTWEASYFPIRDEFGHVAAIAGIISDITDRKALERARAEESGRLQRLFDANLFGVATASDAGITEANDAFLNLVGYSREEFVRAGLDWRKITPPEQLADKAADLEKLKETGILTASEKEYVRKDGRRVPVLVGATLVDREPPRWLAFALDLSSEKANEQHIRQLLQEATHRSVNLIAVIQAIAHQLAKTAGSLKDFDQKLSARLQALANIQSQLSKDSWHGGTVRDLVLGQLAHCADLVDHRILLEGARVTLTAAACQHLGMAIHELCTNALKHGALSGDRGSVTIRWSLQPPDRLDMFQIEWIEAGGPAVVEPTRHGFGHQVITEITPRALEAKMNYRFRKEGLFWSLTIPAKFVLKEPG
jgi:PAS domain S-box-containing protein